MTSTREHKSTPPPPGHLQTKRYTYLILISASFSAIIWSRCSMIWERASTLPCQKKKRISFRMDRMQPLLRIWIRIKVINWIRIRIGINLQRTSQNVLNTPGMSLFENCFKVLSLILKLGSGSASKWQAGSVSASKLQAGSRSASK